MSPEKRNKSYPQPWTKRLTNQKSQSATTAYGSHEKLKDFVGKSTLKIALVDLQLCAVLIQEPDLRDNRLPFPVAYGKAESRSILAELGYFDTKLANNTQLRSLLIDLLCL